MYKIFVIFLNFNFFLCKKNNAMEIILSIIFCVLIIITLSFFLHQTVIL